MIFGFDISSVTIGWCALDNDGSFVDIGYLDLKKEKDLYRKIKIFIEFVEYIGFAPNTDIRIFIEETLKAFAVNRSMAGTICKLQRWNGMICALLYLFTNVEPILIMPTSARKFAGITVPKHIKGKQTKQFILDHVKSLNIIPPERWGTKRTGNPTDWSYDMADAYVVALGGLLKYGTGEAIS